MSSVPASTRVTFWKDHHRYFVRAVESEPVDSLWDTDGATGTFVFPPQDGVLRWRLPLCLEVIPGKEAGEIDVDVAWLEQEPADLYTTPGVASACDISTPSGVVVIADHVNDVVASHDFGAVDRCRVFVQVDDRDVSAAPGVAWGEKTAERHLIVVWPSAAPEPRWASGHRDRVAQFMLDDYRSGGTNPEKGRREPS